MADPRYGIVISQQGIPVKRAADYQKVLDDRWPFLDIEYEVEVPVEVRLVDSGANFYWSVEIFEHNLGFLPAFTYRVVSGQIYGDSPNGEIELVATNRSIYLKGYFYTGGTASWNFKVFLRVYNRDITQEFEYKTEVPDPLAKRDSRKYGARVLKDGVSPAKFTGDEMSDFSLHNNAKVLAIQQTGVLDLNPWIALDWADATAVDTATEIFTIAGGPGEDISWAQIAGQAIGYLPFDYVTYPGGIAAGVYYVIPVGSNQIKLANTYKNALAGVAVNITSAGSLPGLIQTTENPSAPQDRIYHNVGYPPSYWMTRVEYWVDRDNSAYSSVQLPLTGEDIIYPIDRGFDEGFAYATTTYIRFRGVQAVAGGKFAYIIFKDPLERSA